MDQRSTATVVKAFLVTCLVFSVWGLGFLYTNSTKSDTVYIEGQSAAVAKAGDSWWCSLRDWINWPCPTTSIVEVEETPVSREITETKANPEVYTTTPTTTTRPTSSPSTPPSVVNQYTTNEYITNPVVNEIVREVVIRDKEVDTSKYITENSYNAQVDGLLTSIEEGDNAITDSIGEAVDTELLTVSGNTTLSGGLTLATLGGGVLQTDGSGVVSTTTVGASSITADSLDFAQFSDTMTVDATTSFDLDTNNADLNFDSGTLFVDSSTNRVGVGTSSPAYNLHVQGSAGSGASVSVFAQNTNATGYSSVVVGETPTQAVYLDYLNSSYSGSVAGGQFEAGYASLASGSSASGLNIGAYKSNGLLKFFTGGGVAINERMRITSTGNVGIGTTSPSAKLDIYGTAGSSDIFALSSSTNNRLFTVTAAGNVGIGTTSPGQNLMSVAVRTLVIHPPTIFVSGHRQLTRTMA